MNCSKISGLSGIFVDILEASLVVFFQWAQ